MLRADANRHAAMNDPRSPRTAPTPERLTELDALRMAAFVLLILYHVGMFYVPWEWHVKSPQPVQALEAWMLLSSPWRLGLLFLVSGAATGLMRRSAAGGARVRSRRLLLPLLFGMAVIVPPQPYLEVVDKLAYGGSYLDFLRLYFSGYGGFCPNRRCLVLPTWNHLWFVAYLWVYTVLLLAVLRWMPGWLDHRCWQVMTRGARLLWAPWLLLALWRLLLLQAFPSTHNLTWDWFNHALYGSLFVGGAALFGHIHDRHGAWAAALRWRWWALGGAALLLVGMPQVLQAVGGFNTLPAWAKGVWLVVGGARHWLPVLAALGFARAHLHGRHSAWRATLAEAVFPIYITHQTVIVIAAPQLAKLGWPQGLEALGVIALTAIACWAIYLGVRKVSWLRPWFGLPARRAGTP